MRSRRRRGRRGAHLTARFAAARSFQRRLTQSGAYRNWAGPGYSTNVRAVTRARTWFPECHGVPRNSPLANGALQDILRLNLMQDGWVFYVASLVKDECEEINVFRP